MMRMTGTTVSLVSIVRKGFQNLSDLTTDLIHVWFRAASNTPTALWI